MKKLYAHLKIWGNRSIVRGLRNEKTIAKEPFFHLFLFSPQKFLEMGKKIELFLEAI